MFRYLNSIEYGYLSDYCQLNEHLGNPGRNAKIVYFKVSFIIQCHIITIINCVSVNSLSLLMIKLIIVNYV